MRGVRAESAAPTARRGRTAGWLLGLLCLLVVFIVVTGSATAAGTQEMSEETDTEPPTWENATKAGPEEIELIFTDNSTIDRQTIAATDFTLSSGSSRLATPSPSSGPTASSGSVPSTGTTICG